jgi:hypothetical protein
MAALFALALLMSLALQEPTQIVLDALGIAPDCLDCGQPRTRDHVCKEPTR